MKKVLFAALIAASSAFAADYSSMSVTDLQALRGTVPVEDRAAFQSAMQSKMQALPVEDRKAAAGAMRQSGSGSMDGSGSQMRKGAGGGQGRR